MRTPHYGGHIERLIGTMMGKVHLLPGTTFSNVQAKGDLNPDKTAAMTLEEVERWLGHAIAGVYHRELHRGIAMTPLAAWERGIAGDDSGDVEDGAAHGAAVARANRSMVARLRERFDRAVEQQREALLSGFKNSLKVCLPPPPPE